MYMKYIHVYECTLQDLKICRNALQRASNPQTNARLRLHIFWVDIILLCILFHSKSKNQYCQAAAMVVYYGIHYNIVSHKFNSFFNTHVRSNNTQLLQCTYTYQSQVFYFIIFSYIPILYLILCMYITCYTGKVRK